MTWMVVTRDEGMTGVTRMGVTRSSGCGQGLILSSGCYEGNLLLKSLPASCLSFLHSSNLWYPFINIPAINSATYFVLGAPDSVLGLLHVTVFHLT